MHRYYKEPVNGCVANTDGSSSSKITVCDSTQITKSFYSTNDCSGDPSTTTDLSTVGCQTLGSTVSALYTIASDDTLMPFSECDCASQEDSATGLLRSARITLVLATLLAIFAFN